MKIYIATDMEGISGIRRVEQVNSGDPDYLATGRKFLTGDVNAAVAGAFEGGATEVIVNDGHGAACHILIDEADPRAHYERPASSRNIFPALDETFAGVLCVGYHAMAGTWKGFLEHTQSSAQWFNYSVNGRNTGEIGQCGLWAGHFGVPVLMVTGDKAACAEANDFFGPDIVTVAVKEAINRSFARVIQPVRAQEMIREGACRALSLVGTIAPYTVSFPATIRLEFMRSDFADPYEDNPHVKRLDARTIEKTAETALEILSF